MFIDNNGNTGVTVGTTNTGTGYYAFADSDVELVYSMTILLMTWALEFKTAMTIDSSRNVGIGTRRS